MRWLGRRQSTNVEDRRGAPRGLMVGGGIGGVVILLIAVLLGADPRQILQQVSVDSEPGLPDAATEGYAPPAQDEMSQFVSVVLADTEDVWHRLFDEMGATYREPTLVLFTDAVESACGYAGAAVGPFYCPGDEKVYIDLSFYQDLRERFGAPGDFAQAYVIAHEIGHHVQNLVGTAEEFHRMRESLGEREANQISVRMELQADFYAGVWAHHAEKMGLLEAGDIQEAITAAQAIGDDRLQRRMQGRVVPDSFTHGTSEQRMRWFRLGYESGDPRQGDTFSAGARDL